MPSLVIVLSAVLVLPWDKQTDGANRFTPTTTVVPSACVKTRSAYIVMTPGRMITFATQKSHHAQPCLHSIGQRNSRFVHVGCHP